MIIGCLPLLFQIFKIQSLYFLIMDKILNQSFTRQMIANGDSKNYKKNYDEDINHFFFVIREVANTSFKVKVIESLINTCCGRYGVSFQNSFVRIDIMKNPK